eukprot:TRINITY_DN10961_c0_g1_i1.p2 TRINITY_DN10961_c0_g1~~TRINITY_DN10961_c0_g1_i1.p2  ORF type:complete len:454 (+),score=69.29 TRINITY_DN10961_c0_g1_i1:2683-4044(+)
MGPFETILIDGYELRTARCFQQLFLPNEERNWLPLRIRDTSEHAHDGSRAESPLSVEGLPFVRRPPPHHVEDLEPSPQDSPDDDPEFVEDHARLHSSDDDAFKNQPKRGKSKRKSRNNNGKLPASGAPRAAIVTSGDAMRSSKSQPLQPPAQAESTTLSQQNDSLLLSASAPYLQPATPASPMQSLLLNTFTVDDINKSYTSNATTVTSKELRNPLQACYLADDESDSPRRPHKPRRKRLLPKCRLQPYLPFDSPADIKMSDLYTGAHAFGACVQGPKLPSRRQRCLLRLQGRGGSPQGYALRFHRQHVHAFVAWQVAYSRLGKAVDLSTPFVAPAPELMQAKTQGKVAWTQLPLPRPVKVDRPLKFYELSKLQKLSPPQWNAWLGVASSRTSTSDSNIAQSQRHAAVSRSVHAGPRRANSKDLHFMATWSSLQPPVAIDYLLPPKRAKLQSR